MRENVDNMNLMSLFKKQYITSKNLKESNPQKLSRAFWLVIYLVWAVKLGFNALFKECLGSKVIYQGRQHFISNWSNSLNPTLVDCETGEYKKSCPRCQIKNVINLSELIHRFKFGVKFFINNWMEIYINKKVYK